MSQTPKKLDVPPPPRKGRLGIFAPMLNEASDNLSKPTDSGSTTFIDMNFKVQPDFHRRFKIEATLRGLSMKELLEASFRAYLEQYGGSMERPAKELI